MIANPKFYKKITNASSRLVSALTGFEQGSENFDACVEYALSHFQNHRFLDVNAHNVEQRLQGMQEKFVIHSKPDKADTLKRFISSYLASDISCSSTAGSQIHYSLLLILLNLSENPVNSKYVEPTPKKEQEEHFDWASYLLEGQELLHPTQWAWDDTPCNSDDETDLDQSEEAINKHDNTVAKKLPDANQCNIPFDTLGETVKEALVIPYWRKETVEKNAVFFGEDNKSFQIPTGTVDINEINIVREVLWLLAGQTNLFAFPIKEGQHAVCNEILLSHITALSVKSGLEDVAKHGDIVHNLRNFVFSYKYPKCQTYQAFTGSLLKYIRMFQSELISIERRILEAEETILLGDVLKSLTPRFRELSVLQAVFECSIKLDSDKESCTMKATRLLGELYNAVLDQRYTSVQEQTSVDPNNSLLNIWIDSIRPYIDIIDNWLSHGTLIDPHAEFVLQRSEKCLDTKSDVFWYEAFTFASQDCMKHLSWLTPVLDQIAVAGKSVEVLMSLGRSFRPENKSLHNLFVENIMKNPDGKNVDKKETKASTMPIASCDALLHLSFERLFASNSSSEAKSQSGIIVNNQIPTSVLIQRSIHGLIQAKCQAASKELLDVFMNQFGLMSVFENFQKFHLMGWGDVMYDFTTSIFSKISNGEYWEDLMSLRATLQEAISESRQHMDPLTVAVVLNRDKQKLPGANQLIYMTDIIELFFKVEWPLNIVITDRSFKLYGMVFSYLLQVKRALYCLENLDFKKIYTDKTDPVEPTGRSAEGQKAHRLSLLRAKILRLVSHWHNFVMTSVIQAEKEVFLKRASAAENLDGIISAHDSFLDRMCALCLLKQEKQADKMIQGTLCKIFNLSVVLHTKWNRGLASISLESIKKHEAEYRECSEFLGIILQNLISRGAVPLSLESLTFCLMS